MNNNRVAALLRQASELCRQLGILALELAKQLERTGDEPSPQRASMHRQSRWRGYRSAETTADRAPRDPKRRYDLN